ncbi:hypothetical protein VTO73DRAFT_779 [Trametes versicolor]
MSPTCTLPYEVLLEFSNDTPDAATMQVLRREDGQAGPVIFLHHGEDISLVLTAGVAYKYALRQPPREAELSYGTAPFICQGLVDVGIAVMEGITATPKGSPSTPTQHQPTRSSHIRR